MSKTKNLIYNALLLALLIISGKISFPLGAINFTLQLIIVYLIAYFCHLKDALFIIITYIIIGLIGIPIFTYGGGISYIYQPTFGFLIGFIFLIIFVKIFQNIFEKFIKNTYINCLLSGLIGLLINYIFGSCYSYIMFFANRYSFFQVMQLVLLPFIVLDVLKLFLSIFIYNKLKNFMNKK